MRPELWLLEVDDAKVIATSADGRKMMTFVYTAPPVVRIFLPDRDDARVLLLRRPDGDKG